MKGRVYKRGGTWSYRFDIDPDPLTGRRRQTSKGGFRTEREAWQACRTAMRDYERGRYVRQSRRTVEEALTEWLERVPDARKPLGQGFLDRSPGLADILATLIVPHGRAARLPGHPFRPEAALARLASAARQRIRVDVKAI